MYIDKSHIIDAIIAAVYLILCLGLGLFAKKFFNANSEKEDGYFLAGRNVPGWLAGISYGATAMNSDTGTAICGISAVMGLSCMWFFISRYSFAFMLTGILFAVKWQQLKVATGPEFYTLRYNGYAGKFIRIWSSLRSVFLYMVPWIGAGMLALHMLFGPIFGIENKGTTLMIILPILIAYVWISGFSGVLVTDGIQMAVILLSNIFIIVFVLLKYNGFEGIVSSINTVHGVEAENILNIFPQSGHRVFGPLMMLTWMFVITVGKGGDVTFEGQRILSCKSYKDAAKVTIWGQIVFFLLLLSVSLPVLAVLIEHPELYHSDIIEREQAYGIILREYLPTGILGLALSALLAAAMSTISTHLNFGSQTLLHDVFQPLLRDISEKKSVWVGKILMLFMVIISILIMYYAKSLINIAILFAGILGAGAGVFWGQWWWWRVNFWAWLTANIGGPAIYFVTKFTLSNFNFWQERIAISGSMAQQMNMLLAATAIILTTLLWITVALLTKPEDFEYLKKFYRRSRPLGIWGPVRKAVEQEDKKCNINIKTPKYLLLGGIATSIIGVGFVTLIMMLLSEFFVGRYTKGVVLLIISIAIGLWFKKIFNWHLERVIKDEDLRKQSITHFS